MTLILKVEVTGGCSIERAVEDMLNIARVLNCEVQAEFTGVELSVCPYEKTEDVVEWYNAEQVRRINKRVGDKQEGVRK